MLMSDSILGPELCAGQAGWFLDPAHWVAFQPCRHFRLPLSLPSCSPRVFAASEQVSEEL